MLRLPLVTDFLVDAVAKQEPSSAIAALSALAIHRHNPGVQERAAAAVAANGSAALRAAFEQKFSARD